jgi:hypothetical protein
MAAKAMRHSKGAPVFTLREVADHARKHKLPLPTGVSFNDGSVTPDTPLTIVLPKKGSRKLKKHREPNQTEADYGILLAAMKAKGDIVHYGFEEITLRWADQEYTPDYFVMVTENNLHPEVNTRLEILFIELKGGHKWQRNVNTFKTFREQFWWARFEMWQRQSRGHGWERLA